MRIGIDARKISDFGIGTYIRGLLTALVELGGDDQYLAFAPAGTRLPKQVEHIEMDAPHYSIRELFVVGRAAERARVDVLHAPHYVVPFTRVPVIATIHDLIHLHQPVSSPLARIYARTMLRRAARKARRVLTVTETVRGEIVNELGCDPEKVIVTPNGIDEIYRPSDVRRQSSSFLFVGNDKPHKNAEAAVAAIARVPGAEPVLVGGAFERFRGRERVVIRGFLDASELAELYRNVVALVIPSREEGFGLPAAEAMASGTPVITSNAPALVEITGDAALHVDDTSLAAAMTRVMNDETLRRSLAARGIERAKAFRWSRCAALTRDAYGR